jgi:hypothetical protein
MLALPFSTDASLALRASVYAEPRSVPAAGAEQ